MTRQLRRLAAVMLLLFGALFVNLNLIQLVRADDIAQHPSNRRLTIREYQIQRGPIVAGDQEVARSVATEEGELKYLRRYPDPELWAHVTGYYSFVLQQSNLEAAMNEELTGTPTEVLAQNLAELLGTQDDLGNTVRVTGDPRVQSAARQALGDRVGAVVAIEPATGAVLAHYSSPTYDPNPLSSHDAEQIIDTWDRLRELEEQPLLNRAIRAVYPPGSTFKLITAAAALESGVATPDTAFPDEPSYDVPETSRDIGNFGEGPCLGGGTITLRDALRVSCNTVFARLGNLVGDETLIETAEEFGYNRTPPYEIAPVESVIPKSLDPPQTAQSAIGQRDVRVTTLQNAMVVAAIVNGGVVMRPHLVEEVLDPTGRTLRGPDVGSWNDGRFDGRAISEETARQLQDMMVDVVAGGTGRAAAIPGHLVGGKTGTAQVPDQTPTVWFVGFADDAVAVAVVLADAGVDATGGGDAAPIARVVMEAALGLR